MGLVQRFLAVLFAIFLWVIALGVGGHEGEIAIVSVVVGMLLMLWAVRPNKG